MKTARLLLFTVMLLSPMSVLLSQGDVPAEIVSAQKSLQSAFDDLQHAGSGWGGHKLAAMKHIQEAQKELELGTAWAQQHKDVK